MASTATSDLYDKYAETLQIATPLFNDYGGNINFCGIVSTVKVYEDNTLVRAALEGSGSGRVLVIDGGGSLQCALLGDMLAGLAKDNGWVGIIIYGCIRDSVAISNIAIGVKALNTNPRKSIKRSIGICDIPVHFAGVTICPDNYLYADQDGFVIAEKKLF